MKRERKVSQEKRQEGKEERREEGKGKRGTRICIVNFYLLCYTIMRHICFHCRHKCILSHREIYSSIKVE